MLNQKFYMFFAAIVFLFVYCLLRAIHVPILHDEVATFFIYIKSGNFLPWKAWLDANNHFLNSFFAWIMYNNFGANTLSLRFPNVLFLILFLVSVIGISRSISNKFIRSGFIISLFFTHGLIEFFAYARGYGISMAFLMLSVWMLLDSIRTQKQHLLIYSCLAIIPAFVSNLTLIPSAGMIAAYAILLWFLYFENIKFNKKHIFFSVSVLLFLFIYVYSINYIFTLNSLGLLYYGSETGFYNAVLKTHSKMLFFTENNILPMAIILFFFTALILFALQCKNKKLNQIFEPAFFLFPFLLSGSLLTIIVLHFAFNVNFPEDRTSLYLYPFFIGCIFFCADTYKYKITSLFLLPFLFIPVNFFMHINTAFSFQWHYERLPYAFAEIIKKTSINVSPSNVTVSGYKIHELIWGFHVCYKVHGVNLINKNNYPNNTDDYIILRKEEENLINGYLSDYEELAIDKYSNLRLMKRKFPHKRNFLFEKTTVDKYIETKSEYINFFPDTIFDFPGKSLLFEFNVEFSENFPPDGCVLIASVRDSSNNTLKYQALELEWLSYKPLNRYSYSLSVLNIPDNAAGIIVYIWNKHKKTLKIKHASVKVFKFEE